MLYVMRTRWGDLLDTCLLPDQLILPVAVHAQFTDLWERSVRRQTEWGAMLVVDANGALHCRDARPGTDEHFRTRIAARDGERPFGVYHTHVYGSGAVGVAFSEVNIASFLVRPELRLSLVQSGTHLFGMLRTNGTSPVVPLTLLGGNGDFYGKVLALQESETDMTYQEALWLANLHFGAVFRYALYRGEHDQPLKAVLRP